MIRLALIASAALALATTAALADPPPWSHGRGHDGDTPPGLAKKPYGMPPGQAKKLWRRGQYLPRAYFTSRSYYVYEPVRYGLRPPPFGYRWVRVDGDYYLVQTRTGLIADLVASLVR